jgi:hypothetical protein
MGREAVAFANRQTSALAGPRLRSCRAESHQNATVAISKANSRSGRTAVASAPAIWLAARATRKRSSVQLDPSDRIGLDLGPLPTVPVAYTLWEEASARLERTDQEVG